MSDPGDRFEREAEENTTRVMAQVPPVVEAAPGPQATTGAEAPQVQWAADDKDRKDHEEYDGPRYQQVKPSKEGTRSANLRMQDRLAREVHCGRRAPETTREHTRAIRTSGLLRRRCGRRGAHGTAARCTTRRKLPYTVR